MTTTTIGPFTIEHENGEIDQVYETGGLIPYYSDELILAAATEIERLRAALDAEKTGRASAAEGYRDVIREVSEDRERIKAELAEANGTIVRLTRDKDNLLTKEDGDYLRERLNEAAGMEARMKVANARCEMHKQHADEADAELSLAHLDRDRSRDRIRSSTQRIISEIGSNGGPENLEEAVGRLLSRLAASIAASIAAQEKMRRVGNLMSNVCFNLAQHTSTKKEHAATMDGLRREWDLVRLAASQPHAGDGEVGK